MSYFAFGLIDLKREEANEEARAAVALSLQPCATAAGISVAFGGAREPSLLAEMRGDFSAESAMPFLCLAHARDDTSDGLISPHLLGLEGAGEGLVRIADWVKRIVQTEDVRCVRIWLTEGFDVAFQCQDRRAEDLAPFWLTRLGEENEVPSMLLRIVSE